MASERRSDLDDFLTRLRQLGATDDQVAEVADVWDDLDPDDDPHPDAWTRATRAAFMAKSDGELSAALARVDAEFEHDTTTEADAERNTRQADYQRALVDAHDRMGGNVASLLAWVGGDPARALAVLAYEGAAGEGAGRKTLVDRLRQMLPHDWHEVTDMVPEVV